MYNIHRGYALEKLWPVSSPSHHWHGLETGQSNCVSPNSIKRDYIQEVKKIQSEVVQIIDIIWLPEIIDKLAWKHHVEPEEVDQVLFSQPLFRKVQKGHIPGEDVYAALNQTDSG